MLDSCGFSLEKATYRVTLLFIPIALKRLAERLVPQGAETHPESDVRKHSFVLNALLYAVMKAENALLAFFPLPFGSSVFAVARKPAAGMRYGE